MKLARDFWNGKEPLGRRIEIGRLAFQVVGVSRNTKLTFALGPAPPAIYFPLRPESYARPSFAGITLIARTAPGVDGLEPLRREIAALDPNLTPFYAFRMPEQVDRLMYMSRIGVSIHTFDGVFGLILAMIGLAGMTAYSVAQRGREIGIRIALGAQKGDVLRLVMKEGAALVTIGTIIGFAAAWAGVRLLSGITFAMATTTGGYVAEPALWVATPVCWPVWRCSPATRRPENRCASTRLWRCVRNESPNPGHLVALVTQMKTICPECTRLWQELSTAATIYVILANAQKGVAAQRKCTVSDMTQLREAAATRKRARVACNRHDALHATDAYRDFHSVLFAAADPTIGTHSLR